MVWLFEPETHGGALLGTIVNTLAIVAGSLAGALVRGGIPKRYTDTVMQAVGLAVILIGLSGALKTDDILLVIISMVLGTLAGEVLGIEDRLDGLGEYFGRRFSAAGDGFAKGFVTASLVFCVGAMAIVGSLESGLSGDHKTLFAKSILDGVASVVFASTFGIGVLLSAASVFLYQGAITLFASYLKQFLQPEVIAQMSAVGGLLIMAIGLNLIEAGKRIRIGSMLPAVFIPLLYYMIRSIAGF